MLMVLLWVAAALRFSGLDDRPVHADEAATGMRILADRLESGSYRFDPAHFHGPLLSALTLPACRATGIDSWQSMNILPPRATVAACGLLSVAGVLLLVRDRSASLIAAAFAATSPLLVYYSRMYIHEPVLVLFSIPTLAGWLSMLDKRGNPWLAAALLGLGLGAMAATRETFAISLFCWSIAALPWVMRRPGMVPFIRQNGPHLGTAGILALLVIAVGYTDGGRSPEGLTAFFRTFTDYQTVAGHEKPFWFYLHMLIVPKQAIGRWWCEGGILILALCVFLKNGGLRERFLAIAGLLHLLVYSLAAYKTPWLACLGWFQLCMAAGYGTLRVCTAFGTHWKWLPVLATAGVLAFQVQQARAARRFEWDGRNPYAYVPTVKAMEKLPAFVQQLQAVAGDDRPLAVIGTQYWPLPWYLRAAGAIGYWPKLPADAREYPILLLMPTLPEPEVRRLASTHTLIPHGFRDNTPMLIAVRNDVWNTYLQLTP